MADTNETVTAVYGSSEIEVYDGHIDSALHLEDMSGYSYRLGTLPLPDDKFVFSIWAMAVDDMSLTINMLGHEETVALANNTWQKITIYNATPNKDTDGNVVRYIDITPVYADASNENDLYLYKAMLETGNMASDWSPAPEDEEEERLELAERVTRAEQKIEDDNIVSIVTRSDTYRSNLESLHDAVTEDITTKVTQLNDSITNEFTNVRTTYDGAKEYTDAARAWQRFDSDGIHLGKQDNPFTMDLSNEELAFSDNGSKVAYINNQTMHITNAEVMSKMTLGKFAFVPTDTGMALIYVG